MNVNVPVRMYFFFPDLYTQELIFDLYLGYLFPYLYHCFCYIWQHKTLVHVVILALKKYVITRVL